jgi:hypothetical protein
MGKVEYRTDVTIHSIGMETITLGEMAEVEAATGRDFTAMMRAGGVTRKMVALFIFRLRSDGVAPSWGDLAGLLPLGDSSSTSPSSPAGAPAKQRNSRRATSRT